MGRAGIGAAIGVGLALCVGGGLDVQAASHKLLPDPVVQAPPAPQPGQTPASDDGVHITQAQAEAWLKAHVDTTGWDLIAYDDDNASLVRDVAPTDPTFDLDIRVEWFRPRTDLGYKPFRSDEAIATIDCVGRRKRIAAPRLFAENGLKGESWAGPADASKDWTPMDDHSPLTLVALELCRTIQASPPGAKKPPSNEAEIDAWLKANVDTTGWVPVSFDDDGVYLAPEDARGGKTFQMPMRLEGFHPMPSKLIGSSLSAVGVSTYDCVGRRQKLDKLTVYSEHDLKGRSMTDPATDSAWFDLDPKDDAYVLSLCDEALGGASTGSSRGEGPASMAQADVDAWIAKNVKPLGDVYAYYDDDGVYYVHGAVSRSASGTALFISRQEDFTPNVGERSETVRLELDCPGKRLRMSDGHSYPRHNLEGPATSFSPGGDWFSPKLAAQSAQFERLCDMTAGAK